MTLVWQMNLPDSQKLVLLALADCANDEGHCWPSIATLAKKCTRSERTVQGVIRQLEDAGHLTRQEVRGKGCNYYLHPRRDCTPAEIAPPQSTARPPQRLHPTPATVAPKPSRTVKEPSRDIVRKPENLSDTVWADWKRVRRRPVTKTALSRIESEAAKIGWTLERAIEEAAANSWQGFKAEWVKKEADPVYEGP